MARTRRQAKQAAAAKSDPTGSVRIQQLYLLLGQMGKKVERLERQATLQKFLNKIVLSELFDAKNRWYTRALRAVRNWFAMIPNNDTFNATHPMKRGG